MAEAAGKVSIEETDKALKVIVTESSGEEHAYSFPPRTRLHVSDGEKVEVGQQLNEGSLYPADLLAIRGRTDVELYLVAEVQKVYRAQGVDINDKHIELIARQMLKKVRIESKGSTSLLPGQLEDRGNLKRLNKKTKEDGGTPAKGEEVILGITKASLATESFLSAASFQETTKVLTDAALEGKRDRLVGLKENVIIGKLIPAATGLKHYRTLAVEPAVPIEPPSEEGLLDEEELAAELGVDGADAPVEGFGPSFAEELEELAQEIEQTSEEKSRSGEWRCLCPVTKLPRSSNFRPATLFGVIQPRCSRRAPARRATLQCVAVGFERRVDGVRGGGARLLTGRSAGVIRGWGSSGLPRARCWGRGGFVRLLREGVGGRRQLALRKRQRDVVRLSLAAHQHARAGRWPTRRYPMPDDYPDYPNHFQIAAYFDDYVDHFGLRERIRFRHRGRRASSPPMGSGR